jgi:hypothetical protein
MESIKNFWAESSTGRRIALCAVALMLTLVIWSAVAALFSDEAEALEPGWYGPGDGTGQGLLVHCQPSGACGAVLFTSGNGDQIYYILARSCERGLPCESGLHRPSTEGPAMAGTDSAGPMVLGPIEGEITATPFGTGLILDYAVWTIDQCNDSGVPVGTGQLGIHGCERFDQQWALLVGGGG